MAERLERARKAAGGRPPDILVLSGGGVGGAFGAGILVGWSRLGTRPNFQIVTGVSAGALIASFAFLGPGWDGRMVEAFSAPRTRRLLRPRWASALFGESLYEGGPLKRLVDGIVTDDLLRAVAEESSRGRLLLVATTDLDTERVVVWNMGVVAARGGLPARRLFRDILLASASVPGVFPPVLIGVRSSNLDFDEMHVDGGTVAPLLFAPEIIAILPEKLEPLRGANVYIVMDGQLREPARATPVKTLPILLRGIGAALDSDMRSRLELAYLFARGHHMKVRVTAVPNSYSYRSLVDFGPSEINALFNYGLRCAAEGRAWSGPIEALNAAARPASALAAGPAECPAPGVGAGPQEVRTTLADP